MLRRFGAIALALLTLSACDSGDGGPSTPSALVGSWTLQETTTETYLTVNQAQVIVDRSGPTTGTLQLSGAQTGTLRYMTVDPTYGEVRLTSYDQSGPYPNERIEARLTPNGYSNVVFVSADGQYTQYETYTATPYTYAGGRLTVPRTTFQTYTGATVTLAGGTISYQTSQIAASARTLARRTVDPFDDGYGETTAVRYVFEDGGAYRAERDLIPNRTLSFEGTWEAVGTQLRLSTTSEQTTETQAFQYETTGGALRLKVVQDECRQNSGCLRYQEQIFGLQAGSLTTVETEGTTTFAPTPTSARPAAHRAAPHVPADVAARREAALWPRALARPDAAQ